MNAWPKIPRSPLFFFPSSSSTGPTPASDHTTSAMNILLLLPAPASCPCPLPLPPAPAPCPLYSCSRPTHLTYTGPLQPRRNRPLVLQAEPVWCHWLKSSPLRDKRTVWRNDDGRFYSGPRGAATEAGDKVTAAGRALVEGSSAGERLSYSCLVQGSGHHRVQQLSYSRRSQSRPSSQLEFSKLGPSSLIGPS